jgi:hypothetical protein
MPALQTLINPKCPHPLGLGYAPSIGTQIQERLRHKHDLPRYDRHLRQAVKLAKLWRWERVRHRQRNALAALERAARDANEMAFLEAVKEINWQRRTSQDFVRATRLALAAGAHLAARELASEGALLHPDDPEIQKYARTLAPPRITLRTQSTDRGLKANREWIKANAGDYKGRWVALRNGVLLGSYQSLDELVHSINDTKGALITSL